MPGRRGHAAGSAGAGSCKPTHRASAIPGGTATGCIAGEPRRICRAHGGRLRPALPAATVGHGRRKPGGFQAFARCDCPKRCTKSDPRAATADGAGHRYRAQAHGGWPTAIRGRGRRPGITQPAGSGRCRGLASIRRLWLVRMRLGGCAEPTGGRSPWQRR
ncbi:hypothetical protein D3C81_1577930 [compost metagenome]